MKIIGRKLIQFIIESADYYYKMNKKVNLLFFLSKIKLPQSPTLIPYISLSNIKKH